jgi:hypothetical protein
LKLETEQIEKREREDKEIGKRERDREEQMGEENQKKCFSLTIT